MSGAIAVDPEVLRDLSSRLRRVLEEVARLVPAQRRDLDAIFHSADLEGAVHDAQFVWHRLGGDLRNEVERASVILYTAAAEFQHADEGLARSAGGGGGW
jgi:hypothetical protein